jgi:hypothetical protein
MSRASEFHESLVTRALPIYIGLLFALLTAFGIWALVLLRHVLLVVFVRLRVALGRRYVARLRAETVP